MMTSDFLTSDVPDPDAASRFLTHLAEKHPHEHASLKKDSALLSDVLLLVSFSPLFAATLAQDPSQIMWLGRERLDTRVRDKQTMLESLARFAMTHSTLPVNVVVSRFRRRELMRIFLRDVRRLSTIAEITEEISNLADAVLEHALRLSMQELDNRFGPPQVEDDRGRLLAAEFCVISLGKLGSLELNYSSDIDLLFIFSRNGKTSGSGSRGATTNLDYFSKLTQATIKLVGGQGGEGAAYRVDLRLRPHGRVGPLALTLDDTVRYYRSEAAAWERQVLIRSRSSAGSDALYRKFFRAVEDVVFSRDVSVKTAMQNVALSKQKLDLRHVSDRGDDIKLGPGGIREIEFIAQSLQLAYGGTDRWLRAPHTLVSLDRLAERGHLSGKELSVLFAAYDFLRYLEHILQIENGLQTHLVPRDELKRRSIAKRLGLDVDEFESQLRFHMSGVRQIFERIFGNANQHAASPVSNVREKSADETLRRELTKRAPRFAEIFRAHPDALASLPDLKRNFPERDYLQILTTAADSAGNFGEVLSKLRRAWYSQLIEIVAFDVMGDLGLAECKRLQSRLAEASIHVAMNVAKREAENRYGVETGDLPLAVLALGKLGSGSLDYDSDLDLVMVYDPGRIAIPTDKDVGEREIFSRIVEVFTNVLSSITRDGSMYRVDLRLRPHGSDGPLVVSRGAIAEYFRKDAAIWELLAFVNLRAVGGNEQLAQAVEDELRTIIHERAAAIDPAFLASETRAVRDKLEKQKASKRTGEIDIKYGPGGLLDVYFAARFLQLRGQDPAAAQSRSAEAILKRFINDPALGRIAEYLKTLSDGYRYLSLVDHKLRRSNGRSSKVRSITQFSGYVPQNRPEAAEPYLKEELVANLLMVREAYDQILSFEGR
jgi:glutamate-ammonia-ligase adenylyltransferase